MANPNANTTTSLPPGIEFSYRKWVNDPGYFNTWAAFGDLVGYPKRSGDQIKTRVIPDLDSTPVTLAEGIPGAGKQKRRYDKMLTVEQIGDYIYDTDVLTYQSVDNNTQINTNLLMRQCENIVDRRAQAVLTGGGIGVWAADDAGTLTTIRTSVAGRASVALMNKLLRLAQQYKIRPWIKAIEPSTGVSTHAVGSGWPVIVDAQTWFDIKTLIGESGGLTLASKYPQGEKGKIHPAEQGEFGGMRFILTDWPKIWPDGGAAVDNSVISSTTGTNADVHAMVLLGKGSYFGLNKVRGDQQTGRTMTTAKLIHHDFGDYPPLDQINSVGYKKYDGWKIINDTQILRVELAVSA